MSEKLTNNDKVQLMSQAVKMATAYADYAYDDCFKKMVELVEGESSAKRPIHPSVRVCVDGKEFNAQ